MIFLGAEALALVRMELSAPSVFADPASHWLIADTTKL
jgi:hypothetical protein